MDQQISITEKPDSISFDEIWDVVYRSHEANRQQGLKINTRISDGETLREHMGSRAVTYVAMDGSKIAGTVSVRVEEGKAPFIRGRRTAYLMHLAVLPEYKGREIGKALCAKALEYAENEQAEAVTLHVVHRNPALRFYRHLGYEELDFVPRTRLKQNTVLMAYWIRKSGTPAWIRRLRYLIRKTYIQLRYRYA